MYDKQTYVDTLEFGTTTTADVVVTPSDPIYKLIEQRGMPKYPFDLTQAARLMGEAGWTRGADGLYRNAAGTPFDFEVITKEVTDNSIRRVQGSVSMLKAAGLNVTGRGFPNVVPTIEDRRQRSTFRGLFASITVADDPRTGQTFIGPNIRVDPDGVSLGTNTYRYSNPEFDSLYQRYTTTLDPGIRQNVRADLIRFISDQLPAIPLFYGFLLESEAIARNVHGPGLGHPSQYASGWAIHTWDLDSSAHQ